MFVGDVTEDLSSQALATDPDAKLITEKNFKNITSGTYYVSLGDFSQINDFVETLDQAHKLVYCPPEKWTDEKKSQSYMKQWTEFYLLYFKEKLLSREKFALPDTEVATMLTLQDQRKTDQPQLWIAGCSISNGCGVTAEQRYGQLLATQLDLEVSFLTRDGSSISWAADQILRSDIRSKDIVVWGLTSFSRMPYYHDQKIIHLLPKYYEKNPDFNKTFSIERLDDSNMIYNNVVRIQEVINFCSKCQAQLYMFGLMVDHDMIKWLSRLDNYIQLSGRFSANIVGSMDLGTDDAHPGPRTHQWYCEHMLKVIKG